MRYIMKIRINKSISEKNKKYNEIQKLIIFIIKCIILFVADYIGEIVSTNNINMWRNSRVAKGGRL